MTTDIEEFPLPAGEIEEFDLPAGSDPTNPLNQRGVTKWERLQLGNIAPDDESAVKWLRGKGYEAERNPAGGISVRKGGEPWKSVDPSGFDWMDILDIGDETAAAALTTIGAVKGTALGAPTGPGALATGAAGGAAGAAASEAARRAVGGLAGFEQSAGDVAKGIALEGALGATAELGGRAIGAGLKGVSKLFGKKAAAGKSTEALNELQRELAEKVPPSPTLKAMEEAGDIKLVGFTPEGKPRYRGRIKPGESRTPPGLKDQWTQAHKEGGLAARGVQEAARHGFPSSPSGPVTLAKASADQVRRLLDEAGDQPWSIVYVKNPKAGSPELRYFEKAYGKGPQFLPMEGPQRIAQAMQDLTDADLLDILKSKGITSLTKAEKGFFGTDRIEDLSREGLTYLLFRKQPGVVLGKHRIWKRKDGTYDFLGKETKHNLRTVWEQTGSSLEEGRWRSVHYDKILEMRVGEKVYRFTEEGKPFLAGRAADMPVPTQAVTGQGEMAKMATGDLVEGIKKGRMVATPEELAERGLNPGVLGKLGRGVEFLSDMPTRVGRTRTARSMLEGLGVPPETATRVAMLLAGAGSFGTGGQIAAGTVVGAKLLAKGLKAVDRALQHPESLPPRVRRSLEAVGKVSRLHGQDAARAALYVALQGDPELREWAENNERTR
jgi:hypothetical protein